MFLKTFIDALPLLGITADRVTLKKTGLAPEIPEDLYMLIKKAIQAHLFPAFEDG